MEQFSRLFIILGVILIGLGILFSFAHKIPFIGKLPGDIYIQKSNLSFYAPLTTSIIVSIVLSLVLWLCSRR